MAMTTTDVMTMTISKRQKQNKNTLAIQKHKIRLGPCTKLNVPCELVTPCKKVGLYPYTNVNNVHPFS